MAVKPVPDGFHTLTPYLTVDDAQGLINFIEQAFDGKVTYRMNDDEGNVRHAEMKIGDSMIMIGQARDEWKPKPANLCLVCARLRCHVQEGPGGGRQRRSARWQPSPTATAAAA